MTERVRNAGDRKQVQKARRLETAQRTTELADMRTLLRMPEGRRVFHRLVTKLRPLERLWEPSALLQYKAGMHDVGVMILNEIDEADPMAMILMMQEARARELQTSIKETNEPAVAPEDDND